MRTPTRFIAAGIALMVAAGAISNFLITPALSSLGFATYARVPVWSVLSTVFWTAGWAIGALLLWLAARSLLEVIERAVARQSTQGILVSAVMLGTFAIVAGSFIVANAAASLAFGRDDESASTSPIAIVLLDTAAYGAAFSVVLVLLAFLTMGCEERVGGKGQPTSSGRPREVSSRDDV